MKDHIKGQCEHCGFNYHAHIQLVEGVFPELNCAKCGKPTSNFDSASEVEANDKTEGRTVEYELVEMN